jgi:hypothetical protein
MPMNQMNYEPRLHAGVSGRLHKDTPEAAEVSGGREKDRTESR